MTAMAAFAFATTTLAQTWSLLIPSSAFDVSQLNFSNTAFNQKSSIIYSVYKTGSNTKVQSFNLNSNTVNVITTSSLPPVDLYPFTYDYNNNRLIANRAGRENLYAVSAAGGAWSQIGSGTGDIESYGAQFFWNSSNSSAGFFGGYGLYYTKNWVWENSGSWSNPYVNNTICDNSNPAKRNCQYALGAPSSNKLYVFSGQGSCSGQQTAPSCSLGSPWATDVGIYCWLKDLWQLDLTTHSFTNILPVNSSSISKEGQIVYDYTNNTFYILGGYIPSPTYNSNYGNITDYETGVLRFRVGIDNGFVPFTVGGTPPPTVKINNLGPSAAYYDALNNQIVWARKDGIWAINNIVGVNEISESTLFSVFPNPTQNVINVKADGKLIGSVYSIYDNTGRVVLAGKLNAESTTIELGNLSGGIYIFSVGENMKQSFKVIKE